jgi:hypothetical protein
MMSRGSLFFVLCMLFFLLLAGSSFSPRLDVPSGALPVPAGVHEPMRVRVTFHSQAASCSDSCRGPPMGLMVFDLQLVPEGVPVWLFSSAVLSVSAVLFLTAVSVIALLLDFMLGVVRVTAWCVVRVLAPRAWLHKWRNAKIAAQRQEVLNRRQSFVQRESRRRARLRVHAKRGCTCTPNRAWSGARRNLFFVLVSLILVLGPSLPRPDVPSGVLPVPTGVSEPVRVLSVAELLFVTAACLVACLLDVMLGVVRVTAWSMLREVVPRARLHAKRGCTCTPNRAWSAVHDILLVIFRVVFSLVVVLPMTTVSLIALLLHTKMGEQNGTWFHARGTRTRRMANTCVFDGLQKSSQLDPRVIRRARRKFQTGRPIRASQIEHIARYCKVIIVVYTSDCTQYAEYGTWAPRIALVKSAAGDHVEFLPQWQWPVKATLINPKDVAHESYGAGGANIPVDRKRGRNEDEEEDSTSPKVSKQTEDASMHGPHGPVPQEDVHQGAMDVDGMYAVCSFIRSPVFVQTNKRVPYLSHTLPYALKLSTSMGSRRLRMYMRPREVTM